MSEIALKQAWQELRLITGVRPVPPAKLRYPGFVTYAEIPADVVNHAAVQVPCRKCGTWISTTVQKFRRRTDVYYCSSNCKALSWYHDQCDPPKEVQIVAVRILP